MKKKIKSLHKQAMKEIKEIDKQLKLARKAGVKKLPKNIMDALNQVDKQFKDMEKMFKEKRKNGKV